MVRLLKLSNSFLSPYYLKNYKDFETEVNPDWTINASLEISRWLAKRNPFEFKDPKDMLPAWTKIKVCLRATKMYCTILPKKKS